MQQVKARWYGPRIVQLYASAACALGAVAVLVAFIEGPRDWELALLVLLLPVGAVLFGWTYVASVALKLEFDGAVIVVRTFRSRIELPLESLSDISLRCVEPMIPSRGLCWSIRFWKSAEPVLESTAGGSTLHRIYGEETRRPPEGAALLAEAEIESVWDADLTRFLKAGLAAKPSIRVDQGARERFLGPAR